MTSNILKLNDKNLSEVFKNATSETKLNDKLVEDLLKNMPQNTDINQILAKILLIDYTYSTQLHRHRKKAHINKIAQNILQCKNFDELVAKGDSQAIYTILNGLEINLFSFATKYCCLHNSVIYKGDAYSIYDSAVHKLLPKYYEEHKNMCITKITYSSIEKWRKEQKYEEFNSAIGYLLNSATINRKNCRREFDRLLWNQRNN